MIPALTIRITGDAAVLRRLERLAGGFPAAQQAVIRPLGEAWADELEREAPLGRGERPGRLRAGFELDETFGVSAGRLRIANRTPHLRYVLRGRGPVVAHGRALRFVVDGRVIFRRRVGAAAPNPFDERARRGMQGQIDRAPRLLAAALIRQYRGG